MGSLKDKTLFITGASRGIGKAIALRAARDGARIVVVAKTEVPHDRLPGTINRASRTREWLAKVHSCRPSREVRGRQWRTRG